MHLVRLCRWEQHQDRAEEGGRHLRGGGRGWLDRVVAGGCRDPRERGGTQEVPEDKNDQDHHR